MYTVTMITRSYEPLDTHIHPNKVLLIYGARQVGKTTLLRNYLKHSKFRILLLSGDDIRIQQILGSQDFSQILSLCEGYELIAIDEAQNIPNVGAGLKIIVDQIPNIRVVVTGSSSFEIAGQVGEPLTGRKQTLSLYPFSQSELLTVNNQFELKEKLAETLVYGTYPDVFLANNRSEKIAILTEITNSYLFKDILSFDRVRSSKTLWDLLKLLSFQVGCEVSYNELATQVGADVKTVQRYLDLLEKSFVLIRLGGYSRNLRQEVTAKNKYYFVDNGVRNALISQFNGLGQRNDVGLLWENFIFIERIKARTYGQIYANPYFWRIYRGGEIDLIEERDGRIFGYEFKWSENKVVTPPKVWKETYPNSEFHVIHPGNYLSFLNI